jgi:autotransporter-associated beta strand protein
VIGPVVGSDVPDATYTDGSVANNTTYYYVVQAVNPNGTSVDSTQATAEPSASTPAAPAAPTGLTVTPGNLQATLNWNASFGAATYTIQAAVVTNPDGSAPTITVNSFVTATNYTDTGLANNVTYAYTVSAANANGQSTNSGAVNATPSPVFPVPPTGLTAIVISNEVNLSWNPLSNASSYILQRATSISGPYTTIVYPAWLSIFTDGPLSYNTTYYYEAASANLAGISSNSAPLAVTIGPAAPGLTAVPGNAEVILNWNASPGATNYVLQRSTTSGGSYSTIISTTNISYVNTGLVNGATYYYVVYAVGPYGQSPLSAQASATPFVGAAGNYWINTITTSPQSWNVNSNWSSGAFPDSTQALAIVNTAISANQTIDLNQAITIGILNIGSSGGAAAFNLTGNGGTLTLDNTPGQASLLQLSTSKGDTISASMTINGGLLITNASANTFTLSGAIFGATNGITAGGSVTLGGTNTFSGGIVINPNSTVYPGGVVANNTVWGAGAITFMGGTVQFYGYNESGGTDWGGCSNTFNVPFGQTGTLLLPSRFGYSTPFSSALTGGGTLNVTVDYVRDFFTGNWSAFTGQINVSSPPAGGSYTTGDFRINNANGYANAAIYLNSGVNFYNINGNNQTTDIGELGGASGAFIGSGSNASTDPVWRIGARNTTNTYAGVIADSGVTSLIKIGAGTFILTGAGNTYSGGTTVSGGILLANNVAGSATGAGLVTVASGGTLGGTGIISGAVTVNSGGGFAPGNPLGTLTISNNLTLAAGSATLIQVQHAPHTNNAVKITGALAEGGALNVTNISATPLAGGDAFVLFNAASYGGAFANMVLPALPAGLAWNTNALKTNGTLSVVIAAAPVFGAVSLLTNGLVFTGTGGVAGSNYYLLSSTNVAAPLASWARLLTNQFDGNGHFNFTNVMNTNTPQEFYLLELP